MISISWNESKRVIECKLPIAKPTSKARVKREGVYPIATRKEILTDQDYIEWQISYIKDDDELIEFGEILSVAYNRGVVTKGDILSLVERFKDIKTFEETYEIFRSITEEKFKDFKVIYEKIPILRYELKDGCYIDIALRHKQRAVGYQAMIYIYIPLRNVQPKPVGRSAQPKEEVTWLPKRELILGLLKSFLIASRKHRDDMIKKVVPKALSTKINDC